MINATDILRPDNMKLTHDIPIGTLVEVDVDYLPEHGIRAFVAEHHRDCDGEPLYALAMDLDNYNTVKQISPKTISQLMLNAGWSKDNLIVIREV